MDACRICHHYPYCQIFWYQFPIFRLQYFPLIPHGPNISSLASHYLSSRPSSILQTHSTGASRHYQGHETEGKWFGVGKSKEKLSKRKGGMETRSYTRPAYTNFARKRPQHVSRLLAVDRLKSYNYGYIVPVVGDRAVVDQENVAGTSVSHSPCSMESKAAISWSPNISLSFKKTVISITVFQRDVKARIDKCLTISPSKTALGRLC